MSSTVDAKHARRQSASARAEPRLVLAFECHRPLADPASISLADVDLIVLGRASELAVQTSDRRMTIGLPDEWVSSTHARLVRALGSFLLEDAASRNGTVVNGRAVERHALSDGDVIEVGRTILLFRASVDAGESELDSSHRPESLRTLVPRLDTDLERVLQLAETHVAILIEGESGVGKEVLARAVHSMSGRRGAFVGVNCGAIAKSLIESEFFGYVKGAFSGAVEDRPGLVRSAQHGSLFLDEIGDLAPGAQAALLRVLQEKEVLPVGSTRPISVDVRLICATHHDVDELVRSGAFRKDLLARIAGFRVTLPPLRERREDLGRLIGALLRRVAGENATQLSFDPEAARALFHYDWPLNVRELENCLAAAVVFAQKGVIELAHLPESVRELRRASVSPEPASSAQELDDQREQLVRLLREHRGNVSAIARALGKERKQVQRWLKRHALDPEDFR